jgi:NADPH:quinone reductase-like Zn-dependent oxidoreductase
MKAVICTSYGPPEVLQPAEVPKPVPLDNEVLIRIRATTCHFGDVRVRGAILPLWMQIPFRLYMGIRKPRCKILGMELSGVVDVAGKAVRRFARDARKGLVVHKPSAMSFAWRHPLASASA